ncbi:MAG: hypothetical protein SNJ63_10070 [Sphingomonadaceae bacterium]
MIPRLLAKRRDQIVLFTLVELLTHMVFLAVILGLALRAVAEAERDSAAEQLAAAQPLIDRCGLDGSRCEEMTLSDLKEFREWRATRVGSEFRNACLGQGQFVARARALADGSLALAPTGVWGDRPVPDELAPLLREQTIGLEAFRGIAARLQQAAADGRLTGSPCTLVVDVCRAHENRSLYDRQYAVFYQHFYTRPQRRC